MDFDKLEAVMRRLALEAGEVIMEVYGREDFAVRAKSDDSPVTEADLAVDAHLRDRLCSARPGFGWMSEETPDDPAARDRDAIFIVDPIDGTRAFAAGDPAWAHSLAIAREGVVTEAVVHLPMLDRLYAAALGHGAHLNGRRLQVSTHADPDGARLLAGRNIAEPRRWNGPPPAFRRAFRPALSHRLALVAEGRFDATITLRPAWEWDIAAGALLVTEAGGLATPPGAPPHRFNSPSRQAPGFLAANPRLHAAIARRLA